MGFWQLVLPQWLPLQHPLLTSRPCSSTSLPLTLLTYIAVSLMRSLQAPQTHMAFSKATMCMAVMTKPSYMSKMGGAFE